MSDPHAPAGLVDAGRDAGPLIEECPQANSRQNRPVEAVDDPAAGGTLLTNASETGAARLPLRGVTMPAPSAVSPRAGPNPLVPQRVRPAPSRHRRAAVAWAAPADPPPASAPDTAPSTTWSATLTVREIGGSGYRGCSNVVGASASSNCNLDDSTFTDCSTDNEVTALLVRPGPPRLDLAVTPDFASGTDRLTAVVDEQHHLALSDGKGAGSSNCRRVWHNSGLSWSANGTVTVRLVELSGERPLAPATPVVTPVPGSSDSLGASWSAPANTGCSTITSYDRQNRVGTSAARTEGPQGATGTGRTNADPPVTPQGLVSNPEQAATLSIDPAASNAAARSFTTGTNSHGYHGRQQAWDPRRTLPRRAVEPSRIVLDASSHREPRVRLED